jgi:predicted transcriptional regulator
MQNAKMTEKRAVTQFQLTSDLLRSLYKFKLTPVTKLVLLELTTHLNESKNGSVVFPSVNYIAEVLGIGLTATKKAINDLISEGLIIKTKRNKIRGNYNKYLLTPKVQISTSERAQNECFKKSDNDLLLITNKREQNKKQNSYKNYFQKTAYIDPQRYQTGETKRIEQIRNEKIEPMPPEFFKNLREKLVAQCS